MMVDYVGLTRLVYNRKCSETEERVIIIAVSYLLGLGTS